MKHYLGNAENEPLTVTLDRAKRLKSEHAALLKALVDICTAASVAELHTRVTAAQALISQVLR